MTTKRLLKSQGDKENFRGNGKMSKVIHLLFGVVFCSTALSLEVQIGDNLDFPGVAPFLRQKVISHPKYDQVYNLGEKEGVFEISDKDGIVLFSGGNIFVSVVKFSGKFALFSLHEGTEDRSLPAGLLLCILTEEGVFSKRIYPSRISVEGVEIFHIVKVVEFEYPHVKVTAGLKRKNAEGTFCKAIIDLSASSERPQSSGHLEDSLQPR